MKQISYFGWQPHDRLRGNRYLATAYLKLHLGNWLVSF
jgi:hypothetical protein